MRKNGECPVMLRITLNQRSTTLSIKRAVKKEVWNPESGLAKGKTVEVNSLNKYIDAVRAKAYEKYTELLQKHEEITPDLLKDSILGKNSAESKMLLEIWQDHNERLKSLIGKENSYTTWQKYNACRLFFEAFLIKTHKKKDISIKLIDRELVINFEHFLKIDRNCAYNTTVKYLQQLKKIIRLCILNGWLKYDPFINIKLGLKDVDRNYLDERELKALLEKEFNVHRLATIRDIFVFSCFTGLSYSDLKRLNKSELEFDSNGSLWIRSKRQKTGVRANIPVLAVPMAILDKYCHLEQISDSKPLLPVASNQKVNAYLKEIADLCNINKELTFHVARHTFATTVTLTNGVPIESVSKMLGHKNIKQTQHYARIVDLKVGEDMKALAQKLDGKLDFQGLKNSR